MKRTEITLPDDLEEAPEAFRRDQPEPPSLASAAEDALREYLRHRGYLGRVRPLHITPAEEGSGSSDGSVNHDRYLAEDFYERKAGGSR